MDNKINFFSDMFIKEPACSKSTIYIYDSKKFSYTVGFQNNDCVCVVKNDENKLIQFIPVDKNIVFKTDNEQTKSCDGMLYNKKEISDFIIFVELKSGKNIRNWRAKAIKQLKTTAQYFVNNHQIKEFKRKECYASNKRCLVSCRIRHNELNDFAKDTSGFILRINYCIKL